MDFCSSVQDRGNGFDLVFIDGSGDSSCFSFLDSELAFGWHAPAGVHSVAESDPDSFVVLFFPVDGRELNGKGATTSGVNSFPLFCKRDRHFLVPLLCGPGALLQRTLKPSVDTAKKCLLPSSLAASLTACGDGWIDPTGNNWWTSASINFNLLRSSGE